jgi:hypothetical protein
MKSKYNSTCRSFLIFTFICAVSLWTAAAQPSGHLLVVRPANFGWNVAFNLQIDGRSVATVAQGRYFHTWLPAGQHVLTVTKVPRTGISGPTSTTVNIQPGWTHLFTAMWDSDFVFLRPSGAWLTPGEEWQTGRQGPATTQSTERVEKFDQHRARQKRVRSIACGREAKIHLRRRTLSDYCYR